MAKKENNKRKAVQNQVDSLSDLSRQAHKVLDEHVRGSGLKSSSKRSRILDVFLATAEHLSTEELHRLVRAKDPSIGYTTVYRTLKLLAECGLASEVEFHDGIVRYERGLNRRTHHHMVCTSCGNSFEFFAPEIDAIEQRIGKKFSFTPARHNFQIYGTCKICSAHQSTRTSPKK